MSRPLDEDRAHEFDRRALAGQLLGGPPDRGGVLLGGAGVGPREVLLGYELAHAAQRTGKPPRTK